jgi:chromate transporter
LPVHLLSMAFLLVDWKQIYELFKICLLSGAFVFGTGLALIPVLQTNLVDIRHWLTIKEFSDAVIFGQMTPGPVTITGALLGFQISGLIGAFAASIGIFLMPFFHMVTWFPYAVRWLSKQKWITPFLIGATAAVVGSIFCSVVKMNLDSYRLVMFWVLFLANFFIYLKRPKTPIIAMVLLSGLINLAVTLATVNAV